MRHLFSHVVNNGSGDSQRGSGQKPIRKTTTWAHVAIKFVLYDSYDGQCIIIDT